MSLLGNLLLRQRAVAHPDAYGHDVLLAWEFDPEVFGNILRQIIDLLKEAKIPFHILHQEKPGNQQGELWGLKGNDWSHVSIMMLEKYSAEDEKKLEELAKANVPEWTIKGLGFVNPRDAKFRYVVADLDYPPEAQKFEDEFRKYAGDRIKERSKTFKFRPHASLVGIKVEDEQKVDALLKKVKVPTGKIPTKAIQTWDDFQVVDHILL